VAQRRKAGFPDPRIHRSPQVAREVVLTRSNEPLPPEVNPNFNACRSAVSQKKEAGKLIPGLIHWEIQLDD
jgi:hypothetical protein